MNSEPKPFASLSSGLLARKGAARPAMRPQGFGGQIGGGLEDLGWDDMGFEPPKPAEADRDSEHDAFGEELAPHPLRNPLAALTPSAPRCTNSRRRSPTTLATPTMAKRMTRTMTRPASLSTAGKSVACREAAERS